MNTKLHTDQRDSFDDGPGPNSTLLRIHSRSRKILTLNHPAPVLLEYLASKNLTSTFFVVGSRVISRPQILIEEYMSGHEISVHTWAHPVRQFYLLFVHTY